MKKKENAKEKISKIESREITTELRESYLDYAMSVIVSRALPDVRDGLKPVQRRILWAMWSTGLTSGAKFKKSANVVGDVLGKYHPHGDSAIYDALARMAQDFSLRYPLIDGQGNWGSIDGDAQAAMRYCVTGETLVVTNRGLIPISSLGRPQDNSEGAEESIDIEVLSRDRSTHKATKWFDSGEHPTIEVETNHGFSLGGSKNHPVLTWTQDSAGESPYFSWKLLENLKKGDVVVIDRTPDLLWPEKNVNLKSLWPNENRRWDKKALPEELDENLAFVLGALVAEGTIKKNEIEFCNSDNKLIDDFRDGWQRTFPDCRLHHFRRNPSSFGKKSYQTLEIHSRQIITLLRNIGLLPVKSAERGVPDLIFQSPKSVVASFLRAYFEGDGTISHSGKMTELSAISASEKLIKELQIILLRFGIASAKRYDRHRRTHKLYIRGLKNYRMFQDQIGFAGSVKSGKLDSVINSLKKDSSQTDFVPFLSDFVRNNTERDHRKERITNYYNFDRYSNLEKRNVEVATAVRTDLQKKTAKLFEELLSNNYLFDPVTRIKDGGMKRVYSVKVSSECHSFVANGFVNHNTEARLSKIAGEMLTDIEKETVNWQPNYDASREEPVYLPAKLPNLLINGTVGIAVGMATSIPPHNLGEVAEALRYLNDNPDASVKDLIKLVPGPDFPTGGIIYGASSLKDAYSTGRGSVSVRAVADIEEKKKGFWIVITEIPYQVNKSNLIASIAKLHETKRVSGIKDIRDESDREGLRVVIEVKNGVPPQKVLNQLYQYSELQKNIYFNMIALVGGIQPETLSLKDILVQFLDHRKIVVRRRTEFDLRKAEERAHILEGLSKALGLIDKIIATIKKSKDREDAKKNLIKKFKLTAIQSDAILDMKLSTLAALERKKIEEELKEKKKLIAKLKAILKSKKKIAQIVNEELTEVGKNFGGERRTKLIASDLKEFREEDLIPEEDVIITLTKSNYIKRMTPTAFKAQGRGGKGLIGFELKDEDFLVHFLSASSHDNILFFTDRGKVYQTKAYEIPAGTRVAKGKSIHNFLEIPTTEKISAVLAYKSGEEEKKFIVMATASGLVKKTSLKEFENVRRTGIIAIRLKSDDSLRGVEISSGGDEVVLTTALGQAIRFKEKEIRSMSRATSGVAGMRLKKGDRVIGLGIIEDSKEKLKRRLLAVTEKGFAKQTSLKEYKLQKRGGSGIKTAKIGDKTGHMIEAIVLRGDEEEVMVFSSKGQALRTDIGSIRVSGRSTQGVKIMSLKGSDKLIGIVCL